MVQATAHRLFDVSDIATWIWAHFINLTCCRECTQKMLYSLGLSRFGGCMPGLSIIMWQQIGLLIGPNKRRNSISISCVKQDVDGCKWETERCSASSCSSSSVTLLVSSHFSLSFFTIRLFSQLSCHALQAFILLSLNSSTLSLLILSICHSFPFSCPFRLQIFPAQVSVSFTCFFPVNRRGRTKTPAVFF